VAAALGAALFAGGCAGWDEARFKQTTTIPPPKGEVRALDVQTRNGAVEVHSGGDLAITATLRMVSEERLGQATLVADLGNDGLLVVRAEPPPGGWKSSEGCAFDVTVPRGVPAELKTANGEITCRGMSGRGVFQTSNGAVTVLDHDGPVKADTSNGRIEVERNSGPVEAHTSNGSITVRLGAASPGPVRLRTSNGAVTLQFGDAFRGDLGIHTSNGSIHLPSGHDGVSIERDGRHNARLRVGKGGEDSEIETSNGSVTVKF
jgi:DUF4097 and DUF4098 domain-containing protein YvlB